MIYYTCDACGKTTNEVHVELKGVTGTSGGILLPERFHTKHFCCPDCFWLWTNKYSPKDVNPGLQKAILETQVKAE